MQVFLAAKRLAEHLLKQVPAHRQAQTGSLTLETPFEDLKHRHEQVAPFDLVQISLVFRPVHRFVELDYLDVKQSAVTLHQLSHYSDEVIVDHEVRKRVSVLGNHLVQDLHDKIG